MVNKTDIEVIVVFMHVTIILLHQFIFYASVVSQGWRWIGSCINMDFVDGKLHLQCHFVETEHCLHEQKEKYPRQVNSHAHMTQY